MSAIPRFPKPLPGRDLDSAIPESPSSEPDEEGDFVEHPDGWYWVAPDGRQQFGPFESFSLAHADRERGSMEAVDEDETLREVERETGIEDHIDAETGRAIDDEPPAEDS